MLLALVDWSCESFTLIALLLLAWFAWAARSAARTVRKAVSSPEGKHVGRYMLISVFRWFN